MDAWKMNFLLGSGLLSKAMLVSGRVFLQLHPWRLETQDFCLSKATCSSEAALRTENLAHLSFSLFFLTNPRHSMYGIFTYIWIICMVNVGKYASPIECLGMCEYSKRVNFFFCSVFWNTNSVPWYIN